MIGAQCELREASQPSGKAIEFNDLVARRNSKLSHLTLLFPVALINRSRTRSS